jgi:hypothetical protein
MTQWNDPRFIITLLLIALFGFAYINDPADQAMKGAIIGAFSAAYGFWIGSKANEKAAENTGKAFDAITEAARAGTSAATDGALKSGDTVQIEKEGEKS